MTEDNQGVTKDDLKISQKNQQVYDADGMVIHKRLLKRVITELGYISCIHCCFNNNGKWLSEKIVKCFQDVEYYVEYYMIKQSICTRY